MKVFRRDAPMCLSPQTPKRDRLADALAKLAAEQKEAGKAGPPKGALKRDEEAKQDDSKAGPPRGSLTR